MIFCAEMKAFEILSCRPISFFYSEQEEHALLYLSLFSISSRDSLRIEREHEFEVGIEAGIGGGYGCVPSDKIRSMTSAFYSSAPSSIHP